MTTTTVRFKTGDADCSSLIKRILAACGLMDEDTYMWTGNELDLLEARQFVASNLWAPVRGDVLWRSGHTEMYLGDWLQGGARLDENYGVTGPKKGDQTGYEVSSSAYQPSRWTYCMRYRGSKTVGGIPMAEAMAQLMEHAINHDSSHGYSQPNREGDGGHETVTLTYGEETSPNLAVDGRLGRKSVTAWQIALGTYVDGIVSGQDKSLVKWYPNLTSVEFGVGGSSLVVAVQRVVGATDDGIIGPDTVRRLQRWLKSEGYEVGPIDGKLGPKTAKGVQNSLNALRW